MKNGDLLWRLGHLSSPLEPPPQNCCTWLNRFDDPKKEYRTLYAATLQETCLLEILWDWRPDTKAYAEFQAVFPGSEYVLTRKISREWLSERAIAQGRLEIIAGKLMDVEDLPLLNQLEINLAALLHQHEFRHLDISVIRGPSREVTQAIGRYLYDALGASGVLYRSTVDSGRCVALFKGRARLARLEDTAIVIPLLEYPGLGKILEQLGLLLAPY